MFYAVNKVDASDGESIAAYHLWQIAKSLSSGELLHATHARLTDLGIRFCENVETYNLEMGKSDSE